jgi:hypothetical protein
VKHCLLEMYKLEAREPIDAQDLRARFENASHKIARAGIENPTRTGRASAWHAARTACLVVDPDEGNLEEVKIALFKELIKRKYDTARGFFDLRQFPTTRYSCLNHLWHRPCWFSFYRGDLQSENGIQF